MTKTFSRYDRRWVAVYNPRTKVIHRTDECPSLTQIFHDTLMFISTWRSAEGRGIRVIGKPCTRCMCDPPKLTSDEDES